MSRPFAAPVHQTTVLLAAFALSGCVVGPDYAPPDMELYVGERWHEGPTREASALDAWWDAFDDPALSALVGDAFAGNLSLAEARERLVAARAARGIRNAERLPTLDARSSYTWAQTGEEGSGLTGPPPGQEAEVYALGVVAGWELDLWGRVARLVEAADAEIAVAAADLKAVRVALAVDLGRELVSVRALDARIAVVERSIALQRASLEIAAARERGGFGDGLDALRAERALLADEARLPTLRADRRAAELRIATLLGRRAGTLDIAAAPLPAAPALPALGVPAELLTRRPDLRAAERRLAAATARIGAAEAERFPTVSITGNFALSGPDVGDMIDPRAEAINLGPTVTVPLFTGGRIEAQVARQEARQREALAALQRTALEAIEEVERALAQRRRALQEADQLTAAAEAAQTAERLARSRYEAGRSDFLDVLEAQAQLLAIEDRLTLARQATLTRTIDLYAALGGGWDGPVAPPRR